MTGARISSEIVLLPVLSHRTARCGKVGELSESQNGLWASSFSLSLNSCKVSCSGQTRFYDFSSCLELHLLSGHLDLGMGGHWDGTGTGTGTPGILARVALAHVSYSDSSVTGTTTYWHGHGHSVLALAQTFCSGTGRHILTQARTYWHGHGHGHDWMQTGWATGYRHGQGLLSHKYNVFLQLEAAGAQLI
ncbi:hypothetical protein FIBSPDRAFT_1018406 [Athelia psychrophila]|uniref:Uncharacterized protein n=1 Tax=Athelia psychrophila TaxID=1759441 RepID=A0A166KUP5_9AGAM|nr:hypothetical protein FIBSPDRAFT_1018406 [Fibularhizoctonia sp. CBS 109695]